MAKYIIGIDQSTQGTKVILVDESGRIADRVDTPHRQIISGEGYVSHDPEEIFRNTLKLVREILERNRVSEEDLAACGISNQRETTVPFHTDGTAAGLAIVWQCSRAKEITARMAKEDPGFAALVQDRTGIPLSPFFPAAKIKWLLENDVKGDPDVRFGTVDTWLVYRLTEGKSYMTDYSNASRTQLLNLTTLDWDEDLLKGFGIRREQLPEIADSNADFGSTTFGGLLERPLPIYCVLGDSHASLFALGCHESGMTKATYGTGSSIMMNIGPERKRSRNGLVTSIAWGMDGVVSYAFEGNINYSAAVISWLKNDLHLISSPAETEPAARAANPEDTTILVPAFTGLGAPYWASDARAILTGMSRTTGRNEIIKAALESIVYQVTGILDAMEQDSGLKIGRIRVDGGASKNDYLMQFQSDLAETAVSRPELEEFSALGAAYMAGMKAGLLDDSVFRQAASTEFTPQMSPAKRAEKKALWEDAVRRTLLK